MAQPHISARVPQALKDKFEEMAREREIPVSALVQEALTSFVQAESFYERVQYLIQHENKIMTEQLGVIAKNSSAETTRTIIKRLDELTAN